VRNSAINDSVRGGVEGAANDVLEKKHKKYLLELCGGFLGRGDRGKGFRNEEKKVLPARARPGTGGENLWDLAERKKKFVECSIQDHPQTRV